MNKSFLLLGGNLGDVIQTFHSAFDELSKIGEIKAQSSLYTTKAWGKNNQPDFLNQVVQLDTLLDPFSLLHTLLNIEKKLGRVRQEHWGERIIDIDILFYNTDIIECDNLKIPHPHLHKRLFTLIPLSGIASGFIHPTLLKTTSVLIQSCEDTLDVTKYVKN